MVFIRDRTIAGSNLTTPILLIRTIIGKMDFKKKAEIDIMFLCLMYYFFIDTEC
jgi:hypothetical protein